MAKAYNCRPSQLLDITSPFDAYRLDRAVYRFGTHVDAKLESVEGKTKDEVKKKRLREIDKYFPKAQGASGSKKFSDPASRS